MSGRVVVMKLPILVILTTAGLFLDRPRTLKIILINLFLEQSLQLNSSLPLKAFSLNPLLRRCVL